MNQTRKRKGNPVKPTHSELIRLAKEASAGLAITMSSNPLSSNPRIADAMFSGASLERFVDLVIADFLQRTGQYVTNDAIREDATNTAHLEGQRAMKERAAIHCENFSLAVSDSDWSKGYATALKDAACGIRAMEAIAHYQALGYSQDEIRQKVADDEDGEKHE